ncbi:ArnT family glycosyltransferase [Loigolactobacillus rennini]|uniref:Dolichyl-phosphate-mannose-protein mannosyltransferase n=1 Tax=Loigolactobacillus rennini DSM 20253 TaxID=1423796 RepID=A0A0R2D1G1_9LACO|nr:glycosyltransferase family 39 protein [Loigolactobacillus rennini]KRM95700.1 dolichyl-phosphate-mannose-protein mannosyltransferase [Loigolactobacillus rennini DSM 20253]
MIRQWVKRQDLLLWLILCLALVLYGWGIWTTETANSYYTAAVTSMIQNWHNFWYGAFDPAGFITVDKPPVALWFMAISAKIFGVHGWSVILPSVLFGLGTVGLIYQLVKRHFGRWAALIAALVMTLTPIVVADTRSNNMDATLIFFLVLAGYLLQKAVDQQKSWLVMLSFGLIGVGFNIKMLQAFMVLPAMYIYYLLATHQNWQKKWLTGLGATIVLVVLTLAWPLTVDSTSASQRPYIGSSQKNSVLDLAFGYNGSERLLGQSTGTGGAGGAFNIGTAGPLRLFQSELGPQISWLLPFSLLGLISAYAFYRDRRRRWYQTTKQQQDLWYWAAWLVPVAGFFSVASFFHPYYLIMLAPPLAALTGIGSVTLTRQFRHGTLRQWSTYLLPLAIGLAASLQAYYVRDYYQWASWSLLLGGWLLAALLLLLHRQQGLHKMLIGISLIGLMLAPGYWALTPMIYLEEAQIPTAGPDLANGGGTNIGDGNVNSKMLAYLQQHQAGATYLFATSDASTAAPYIIKSGQAVMALGGFNGTDPTLTLKQFKKLVKTGELKYFYVSGKSGQSAIINWVKKHGIKVKKSLYQSTTKKTEATKQGPTMKQPTTQMKTKNQPSTTGQPTGQLPANGKISRKSAPAKPTKTKNKSGGMTSQGTLYRLTIKSD